jgi:5'-3' exoribonuclease 1
MGIPSFVGAFLRRKKFRNVVLNKVPVIVNELLFDLNGLIHGSAGEVYGYGRAQTDDEKKQLEERREQIKNLTDQQLEREFLDKIIDNLTIAINTFKPTTSLIICIDGVAPGAKINQQRQRRYKAGKFKDSNIRFNSANITPGTDLMFKIDAKIKSWINENYLKLPPLVIYSGHLTPGEGEHKLFRMMREGKIGKGNIVIFALDADLIFLSLLSEVKNIYLSRENEDDIINIDGFREALQGELLTGSAVSDFALITFLIGNDFLPHQSSAGDILDFYDRAFIAYRTIRSGIIEDGEINWESFTRFIENLSRDEEKLLEAISAKKTKYPNQLLASSFTLYQYPNGVSVNRFNYNTFRGFWYLNALNPKGNLDVLDIKMQEEFSAVGDQGTKIEKMCRNYLTTIIWNYKYYTEGTSAINPEHLYYYNYAPLLSDLAVIMKDAPSNLTEYKNFEGSIYFTPLHQLISVIPLSSKEVLPDVLLPYLEYNSPVFDLFVTDFTLDLNGVNYENDGIAILPSIDIVYIWNNLQIDSNILQKYAPKEEITISQGDFTEFYQSINESRQNIGNNRGRGRGREATGNTRGGSRGGNRGRGGSSRARGTYTTRCNNRGGYSQRCASNRGYKGNNVQS